MRAAQNLQKLGCRTNDIFGLMAENSHHVAPICFAAFCLGCPINGFYTTYDKSEMLHMLNITRPKLMFCDLNVYDLVETCLEELKINARIFTFGGSVGKSIPVEELFMTTHNETNFM